MPLNARLVVVGGEVKTAEIKLRLPSTIGRGRGATIMLPHPLVSRQHCELFENDGRLMVRDLGSLNGTFINNQRISEAPLPTGELLTVGAVTFRAVYDAPQSSAPPPGPGPQLKSGKVRDTDANGTLRSGSKPAPAPPPAAGDFDEVDFNFDEPLAPVDEAARVATQPKAAQPKSAHPKSAHPKSSARSDAQTEPAVETIAKVGKGPASSAKTVPAPPKPAATAPAAPAAPAKPAAPAPAQPAAESPAKDDKPVSYAAWDMEDQVDPKGESDDDFGDFLKSLGEK